MVTVLEDVYRSFLNSIEDEDWLLVEDEVVNDLLLNYLEKATIDFTECRKSLEIDYDNMSFFEKLDLDEIIILSKGMLLHYLDPKIMREQNLENAVTSKDFTAFSNSNQLRQLVVLKEFTKKDLKEYITSYDYKQFEGLN